MPRVATAKTQPPLVTINTAPAEPPAHPQSEKTAEERSPTWFWDMIWEFPKDDWGKTYDIWLQRMGDSRVPVASGEKGYLDMFLEPISPATVKAKYGGGKYRAILRKNSQLKTSHDFEIEGSPIYAMKERPGMSPAVQATNSDASGLASQFISILREEMEHLRGTNQGSNAAGDATVTILSNAAEKAAEIMQKQIPQAGNPATVLKDLVGAMKEMGVIGGGQHESTLGSLVKELTPLITLLTPLLAPLLKPADPLAQLTGMKTLIDMLDDVRGKKGGGGGSRGATTEDVIIEGIKTLPDVLDRMQAQRQANPQQVAQQRAAQLAEAQRRSLPNAPAGSPPQTTSPQAALHQAAPVTRPGAAPPLHSGPLRTVGFDVNNSGPAEFPADQNVGASTSALPAEPSKAEYDAWVGTRVVEMLYLGFDGDDIVAWLDIAKPETVRDLDKYTDAQIESLFALDPILSRALQHPNWKNILAQAKLAAADIVAEEAEDTEDESELAVPKVN